MNYRFFFHFHYIDVRFCVRIDSSSTRDLGKLVTDRKLKVKGDLVMLQVKQASKIYEGKIAYRALTDINLTIDKGEFVGIMGPSGSGKTHMCAFS